MTLSTFDVAAIVMVLTATIGYVNYRFVRLPRAAGFTIMGALVSLSVVAIDRLLPSSGIGEAIVGFLDGVDFHATLMDGMLSFLLFAGALHVNWTEMRRGRWPILFLSTIGVLISTLVVGSGSYLISNLTGLGIPFLWCLVFGALISPTDPVAVMSILKRAEVRPTLKATVAGESLFNDGVGIVVFTIILAAAVGAQPLSVASAGTLFLKEAGGGVMLGLAAGWIGYRAMHSIDDYQTEVMISLAVVMGGYALAHALGISGPVSMATAGLIIGNHGVAHAMSDTTRDYLLKFWSLIDDILNAVLFLVIGLEVIMLPADLRLLLLALLAIPLVVGARALSVLLPLALLRRVLDLGRQAPLTLIWGGLRGGISVALALGLPEGQMRSSALAATYMVVLFSVLVQGGTIEWILKRTGGDGDPSAMALPPDR